MTIDQSRRTLLAGAGALTAAWPGLSLAATLRPDLVVVNANVYTVDDAAPRAQALAISGGRFTAVGTNEEIRSLAGPGTQTFDAQGMTIVPGFIDTHCHPYGTNLLYDVLVGNPFEVEFVTLDSIIAKLRAKAQQTPPDYWIEGYFYDDTKVRDGREINRFDLDKVSTTHPVVVRHRGGHTSYYNTKALQMAGVTKATPDIQGGTYDKMPNGELSGRVTDTARRVFENVGKRETFTPEQEYQRELAGAAHISKQFARYGLTGVHHNGGPDLGMLQTLRARGDLLHRVSYETSGKMLDAQIANGIRTGVGDEWIRFGATSEHTTDGSFSERTAGLSHPYPGSNSPYQGNITFTQDELNAWVERVHRAGIQVNLHANGDAAIEMSLNAFERANRLYPTRDARWKITHCTFINDDILRRMKALNVVPAVFTTYAYYNSDKFKFYGEAMMKRAMPFREFLDAGIHATAGSDFRPGPFAPLMGIQGMVTRKGWNGETWGANQRITVAEAIKVQTLNGAYASFEENIKGSITPGKLADFVVLAEDPHTANPEKIKDIKIFRTVAGGRTVYQA
ncbi:amidohydrolase [Phenylobacterium sp.]|jgi:predicted amidohydrolase YtcJ|uniref:amidohydrolase n=1 Tax=Phenylobacterium sp. TaxID=1871053 RepID=UPI0037835AEC